MCSINYPPQDKYKECPKCHETTSPGSNLRPIKKSEAESIASNAMFEEFYEKWDAEHDPERLVPDFDPEIARKYPLSLLPDRIPEPEKA